MMHDWLSPRRRRTEICRRLDRLAEWANPVLLAVAALLLILDLSCLTAWGLPPLHRVLPPPPVAPLPPAG